MPNDGLTLPLANCRLIKDVISTESTFTARPGLDVDSDKVNSSEISKSSVCPKSCSATTVKTGKNKQHSG